MMYGEDVFSLLELHISVTKRALTEHILQVSGEEILFMSVPVLCDLHEIFQLQVEPM